MPALERLSSADRAPDTQPTIHDVEEDPLWTSCSHALKRSKPRYAPCSGGYGCGTTSPRVGWGSVAEPPATLGPRRAGARDSPDRNLWERVNVWYRLSALDAREPHITSVTSAGGRPKVVITGANLRR